MRTIRSFQLENTKNFKQNLLLWSAQFEEIVWLDSNNYPQKYSSYDAIMAVDANTFLMTDYHNAFDTLKEYQSKINDWIFGSLSYDLKNNVEELTSNNQDGLEFPDLYFFQPKKLFLFKDDKVELHYLKLCDEEIEADIKAIKKIKISKKPQQKNRVKIKLRIHKEAYFEKINTILAHIHRGDIYEANFCQEFYSENTQIDPFSTYSHLNDISKAPFATFLKLNHHYLLCASPERYLKKEGSSIISQPIKGTAKRLENRKKDLALADALSRDRKERSENIMIVDLVRNDLSRTAKKGSVQVKELCKVYTFEQVHQLISTVVSEIDKTVHPVEVLRTTFPMGSMTGAPKISAMKIIEDLEETKRGLYSGAVGYFTPSGNFDFNVVIRSILYNELKKYISYSVGGAITSKSNPLKEYEECLIKAKAMREVLE